jgi:hypothetical protein
MAKINVPRAELAALVGLPASATDAELNKALAALRDAAAAREAQAIAAAAEQQLVAEDRQIVNAAIAAGKIPNTEDRRQFWIEACARDRANNRAMIASLAAVLPTVADAEAEAAHAQVMASLGLAPKPRSVAASSGFGQQPGEALPAAYGSPEVPVPVLLHKGKDPRDYTREEQYQDFVHKLGIGRRLGVPRPPAADSYYVPSPNDPYEFNQSTGQFEPKPNNQARQI